MTHAVIYKIDITHGVIYMLDMTHGVIYNIAITHGLIYKFHIDRHNTRMNSSYSVSTRIPSSTL